MLHKHRRTALGQTIAAGKSSRRSSEKKKTAASTRSFTYDPKAVLVPTDEE
jgi:hypothetical protein